MSRSLLKRLKVMAPAIEWTTPIPVHMSTIRRRGEDISDERKVGFLCRICVADRGFSPASDPDMVYADEEACLKHIEDSHVGSKN